MTINLTLKIWRQSGPNDKGSFKTYKSGPVSTDISFLEMLDILNENLTKDGDEPVAFDHDCREGICGTCGAVVNGIPHGPEKKTTLCQLHMRHFEDGDTIIIEPFRARAFKMVKDLVVDRSPLDAIIQSGGYISVGTGSAPEANTIPISRETAEKAMDSAECIGCGACVASCPNASAMLFTAAKISQLALLPQGKTEAPGRVKNMVKRMDALGFGNCTNATECAVQCPKQIPVTDIARINREYIKALLKE